MVNREWSILNRKWLMVCASFPLLITTYLPHHRSIYHSPFTIYLHNSIYHSCDSEPLPQSELQSIHFSIISLVVITTKVQQTMENQLFDFDLKGNLILFRLLTRSLKTDDYFAEI